MSDNNNDEDLLSAIVKPFYCNRKRQKKTTAPVKSRKKLKRSDAEPLQEPSEEEKQQILANIARTEDKHLQMCLFEIGCYYVLLPHQFAGVRAIAGLQPDFPGLKGPKRKKKSQGNNDDDNDYIFDWVAKIFICAKARRQEEDHPDRGILVADEMGTGKTVQAVIATILRQNIALAKGQKPKPTLIISPNDAVLSQWQDTLIYAGVKKTKIVRYIPKDNTFKCKSGRFILCTRYCIQTEGRYLFSQCTKNKAKPDSSLFKNAPKQLLLALKNQYLFAMGKAKNEYKEEGETVTPFEVVTRLLVQYQPLETMFDSV